MPHFKVEKMNFYKRIYICLPSMTIVEIKSPIWHIQYLFFLPLYQTIGVIYDHYFSPQYIHYFFVCSVWPLFIFWILDKVIDKLVIWIINVNQTNPWIMKIGKYIYEIIK